MSGSTPGRNRVQSLDILRGSAMVIMALDHVRDFFYKADLQKAADAAMDPTNMATTTPALFFTRWITHFCAPVFVFLAGTSVYLMGQKKSKAELSAFLIKRGIWLIVAELFIVTLGWTFNPFYNFFIFQVIWAIGISMVLLGFCVHLPYKFILAIGLIIVAGLNLMDIPSIGNHFRGGFISDLLYFSNFSVYSLGENRVMLIVYAFLPWTGLMLLGYCFGRLYRPQTDSVWRNKILIRLGLGLSIGFVLLRLLNLYGDASPWAVQSRGLVYTFLSFLNLTKYPASLLFFMMTMGPALILLAFLEKAGNAASRVLQVYGRVPMFYYILHFYLIHLLVVVFFFIQGFTTDQIVPPGVPFLFRPPEFGFNLWGVYAVWIFVVVALYPLCAKYNRYKSTHNKWWLSYV